MGVRERRLDGAIWDSAHPLGTLVCHPKQGCASMEGFKQGSLHSRKIPLTAMWKMNRGRREWGQGDQAEGCGN